MFKFNKTSIINLIDFTLNRFYCEKSEESTEARKLLHSVFVGEFNRNYALPEISDNHIHMIAYDK